LGFGLTDNYLDLWCGHLTDASELVDRAAAEIVVCSPRQRRNNGCYQSRRRFD
jgi:hypothetical protein